MLETLKKFIQDACPSIKIMLTKIISRKFIVWLIATHMTYIKLLESSNWMFISLIYVGAQTALDWKNNAASAKTTLPAETPEPKMPARPMQ